MLIKIQTSTEHIIYRQLGVYIECILPVSIYMCLRLIELLSKILKQYRAKCMRFFKIQLVSHCYTAVFVWTIIQALYLQKSAVYLSDCSFFFCKIQELRNPTTHKFVMLLLIALIYRRLLIFTTMIYYDYNTWRKLRDNIIVIFPTNKTWHEMPSSISRKITRHLRGNLLKFKFRV